MSSSSSSSRSDYRNVLWNTFLSPIIKLAAEKTLVITDLPFVPTNYAANNCFSSFTASAATRIASKSSPSWLNMFIRRPSQFKKRATSWPLLLCILRCHYLTIATITILKILNCLLSFAAPVLLGRLVNFLSGDVTSENFWQEGVMLVLLLSVSSLLSAIINTSCNIRALDMKMKLQSALTCVVFERYVKLPQHALPDLGLNPGQILNFAQVDIDQVANFIQSVNDVWSLPLQIVVAFVLLYLQVAIAFAAGVILILIGIPLNTWIARQISINTQLLLDCKDKRVKLVLESFNNFVALRSLGFETAILSKSNHLRNNELIYLSRRKYFDALCVFLWAATPVLVPFATFAVAVSFKQTLTAGKVITTMALLQMLIFPLNALPWVVNGLLEARVSLRRLALLFNDESDQYLDFTPQMTSSPPFNPNTDLNKYENDDNYDEMRLAGGSCWAWANPIVVTERNTLEQSNNNSTTFPPNSKENQYINSFQLAIGSKDLIVKRNKLTIIVGPTGSGKTSLLLALLNEMRYMNPTKHNHTRVDSGSSSMSFRQSEQMSGQAIALLHAVIATDDPDYSEHVSNDYILHSNAKSRLTMGYCSQSPSILSGTIRSNILLGNAYDHIHYSNTIHQSLLSVDLQSLSGTTSVGTDGSKLSGGQKQRVALARLFYSASDILLLDDPFAALDQVTAIALVHSLKLQLVNDKRGLVITTHSLHLLPLLLDELVEVEHEVVLLDHGKEVSRGTFDELQRNSALFVALLSSQTATAATAATAASEATNAGIETASAATSPEIKESFDAAANNTANDIDNEDEVEPAIKAIALEEEEQELINRTGRLSRSTIAAYLYAAGPLLCLAVLLATAGMQVSAAAFNLWLGQWGSHAEQYTSEEFLMISGIIVAVIVVLTALRSLLFASAGLRACRLLYVALSTSVMRAKTSFHESTAPGQVSNRLGRDTNAIDDSLPFIANILLAQSLQLLGASLIMAYNFPPIILALFIASWLYRMLQSKYRHASRQLRRLDSAYKSPVYTILADSVKAAVTLRSLSLTAIPHMREKLCNALNNSFRVSSCLNLASQWLGLRLQLLGSLVTLTLAAALLVNRSTHLLPLDAGLAGVALLSSFSFVNYLNGLVNALSETEQELVSVERVLEYCRLPRDESLALTNSHNEDVVEWERDIPANDSHAIQVMLQQKTIWSLCSCSCCFSCNPCCNLEKKRKSFSQSKGSYRSLTAAIQQQQHAIDSEHQDEKDDLAFLTQNLIDQEFPNMLDVSPMSVPLLSTGLDISNLCMSYANSESTALQNITFHIPPGSRIAITGRTGSGKTSLLRCLLRLQPYSGQIMLDGVLTDDVAVNRLRGDLIATVSQQPLLFAGLSLRANLDPDDEKYSDEQMLEALQASSLMPSLLLQMTEDNNMQQILDMDLPALSAGQQQLLCLARALLRRSSLLLLDEVAAALDQASYQQVLLAVAEHCQRHSDTIVLTVCHRLEGVELLCNQELKMDAGRVIGLFPLTVSHS